MTSEIHNWLEPFGLDEWIRAHVLEVMLVLPIDVRRDLMGDPAFVLHDYDPPLWPAVTHVPVGIPMAGRPSRSVSLKRTLRRRPVDFVRWVIAHELAHAHLRNRGRSEQEDPEVAADSLAQAWGFPRPPRR